MVTESFEQVEVPCVEFRFSADSPYKICQLYAEGKISRERTVVELGLWRYKPHPGYHVIDQVPLGPTAGTWDDVVDAADEHLIDIDMYGDAMTLRTEFRDG